MTPIDTGPPEKTKAAGPGRGAAADGKTNDLRDYNNTPAPRDASSPVDRRNGRIRYVRWWLVEQAGRTSSLSCAAVGAYVRLFAEYLRTQSALPDDPARLSRITKVSLREWSDIREELAEIYDLVDGHLVDDYAEKCIAEFRTASARNRRNVMARYHVVDGNGGAR